MKIDDMYQEEQNKLLKFILNKRYFEPWQIKETDNLDLKSESHLELFITASCNQHCEYCYLYNNEGLYPIEYRDTNIIKQNLYYILDWMYENNYTVTQLDLFSGEIWQTDFGIEILDILYNYAEQEKLCTNFILIASNCSFLLDNKQMYKIQRIIDNFEKLGIRLAFSISVDGKIIEEDTRPLNNNFIKTDEFYEKMFLFAEHNGFAFHPMVSAYRIEKWIDNFKWWEEQCEKYNMNVDEHVMLLEVRNNDWTKDKIKSYCDFLKFLVDRKNTGNIEKLVNYLFNFDIYSEEMRPGYSPQFFPPAMNAIGCSASDSMIIRLGDLAICSCHRTSYNKLLYGKFIVENNKIVDIKANNVEFAIRALLGNENLCGIGCDSCIFSPYCLKGCRGSQYENTNDPLCPVPGVCEFFKSKYTFLIKYYKQLGILDYIKLINNEYKLEYNSMKQFLHFAEEVLKYNYDLG